MKNKLLLPTWIAIGLETGLIFSVFALSMFVTPAEAACRPTGRFVKGIPVVRCVGRTRCRFTGRFKTVHGVRYRIIRCPSH